MLGHDGPPETFWKKNLLTEKPLDRCPVRTLQLADQRLVAEIETNRQEIWPLWKRGLLLSAGGVEDQSARYLDMMREFDRTQVRVNRKAKELDSGEPGDLG